MKKKIKLPERDNEIANVIPKLRPPECNKTNSQIEELPIKNNTEQNICNEDNANTLEEIQFVNNTEESIAQIYIHKKGKEDSTEHKK